jgi:aspartate kinase
VIVLKFGGTSVGDAEAIARTGRIVSSRADKGAIVVVSALAGVTNALIGLAEQAAKGHLIGAIRAVEGLRERHLEQVETLLGTTEESTDTCAEVSAMIDELAHLAAISSFGEKMSSLICVAAFVNQGLPAVHVDACEVMITDATFSQAEPQSEEIALACRASVLPLVRDGKIPVMGGFIGSAKGTRITTTLGRGGSDYSASLFGAAVNAEAIEIWTDVDGMLTADPRVVPNAQLIQQIAFDEASELASFGAKVLHPNTIAPAVRLGIPVYVLNSRRPEGTGTKITFEAPKRSVSAIAGKNNITLIKIGSPRMLLTEGFLRALFEIFERHRTSVDVVATSEVSVSLTVDDASRLEAIVGDLRALGDVAVERNRGIVAVVGGAIAEGGGAMARALGALGDVRVHMLSLSATGINLTMVVDDEQVKPAMQRLHAAFFGEGAAS